MTIEPPGVVAWLASGRITSAVLASRSPAMVRGRALVEREFMASHFSWRDVIARI
jgi:hypothetical protein